MLITDGNGASYVASSIISTLEDEMTVDINTLFSNKPIENREPYIILEAGINHNGDVNIAKKMISVAKSGGG